MLECLDLARTLYRSYRTTSRFHFRALKYLKGYAYRLDHLELNKIRCNLILRRLSYPILVSLRVAQIAIIFGPILSVVTFVYLFRLSKPQFIYRLLSYGLKKSGSTFIKLGQWAATRPDILSIEFCQELSDLHSNASPHNMAWNKFILRKDFGIDMDDVFSTFSKTPLGSGTIAQVHFARLKSDDSKQVAVKICHPDIEEKIDIDLKILHFLSYILNSFSHLKWLNLPDEVKSFSQMMHVQTDLRYEAYGLDRLRRNFSTWSTVVAPAPISPFISKNILFETYEPGVSIDKYVNLVVDNLGLEPVLNITKKKIATTGLQAFLQMLLWDNFVHADLHPGNILVRFVDRKNHIVWAGKPTEDLVLKIRDEGLKPQLVFLDAGLMTELSSRDRRNFNDLFQTLVLSKSGFGVGELIIERSPELHRTQVSDRIEFCKSVDRIVKNVFRTPGVRLENFAIGASLLEMFKLVQKHHVHLDSSFTNIVMSFLCVEGLGRRLSPDLNLVPFFAKAALQYLIGNVAKSLES